MIEPDLNCEKCKALHEVPACAVRRCHAAHLMNPGFPPWLLMFRLLKSELLSSNGLNARTLDDNEWSDLASQLIFAQMETAHAIAVNEKRESEAEKQRQKQEHTRQARRGR